MKKTILALSIAAAYGGLGFICEPQYYCYTLGKYVY